MWSDGEAFLGRKGAETTGRWVQADYRFEVIEGARHWLPDLNAEGWPGSSRTARAFAEQLLEARLVEDLTPSCSALSALEPAFSPTTT